MTTFLNLIATRARDRAHPGHGRQLEVDASSRRASSACRARAIVNSICLKEGEADFLRKARIVRRYGAGVVVMAFDETGPGRRRSSARSRSASAPTASSPSEVGFRPEDIIFDPNILAIAHRHRGARRLRASTSSRRRAIIKDDAARARRSRGGVQQPLVLVPRQQRRARGDALGVPLSRDPGRAWTWASSTPASSRSTRTSRRSCSSTSRTSSSTAAPTRPSACVDVRRDGEGRAARSKRARPRVARRAGRGAARARARATASSTSSSTTSRRRGRSYAAAARRHRGAADGRHERRRRPVRRRQDVPAAGRQERARDEEGGRVPRAVHGGGEGSAAAHAQAQGQDRAWPR